MIFDQKSRQILGSLADELIPASETMPSATQADVAEHWHEAVLAARPDLKESLGNLIRAANGKQASDFVLDLRQNDEAGFGVLAEVVCGAYFMNPDVQNAIGYSGQGPRPIDPRPDYMEDGLLESVIRRGPVYRPTPKTQS